MVFNEFLGWDADWVQAYATIVGFFFLHRQILLQRVEIQKQNDWAIYQSGIDSLSLFLEHPEIRPFFYKRDTPLPMEDSVLRNKVMTMAEVLSDHWEIVFLSKEKKGTIVDDMWLTYIKNIYYKSPTLQFFLREDIEGHRYADSFKKAIKSECDCT